MFRLTALGMGLSILGLSTLIRLLPERALRHRFFSLWGPVGTEETEVFAFVSRTMFPGWVTLGGWLVLYSVLWDW